MRNHALRRSSIVMLLVTTLFSGCAGSPSPRDTQNHHHLPNSLDYYPEKAKCLGLTGRVGLEASCVNGRFHNVVVIDSAGPILDGGAKALLSAARCKPGDPPESSSRFGVIFELTNKPRVPPFEDDRQIVTVTGIYPPVYPTSCR